MLPPSTPPAPHTRSVRSADQVSLSQPGRSGQEFGSVHGAPQRGDCYQLFLLILVVVSAKHAGKSDQALVALRLSVHANPWPSIC